MSSMRSIIISPPSLLGLMRWARNASSVRWLWGSWVVYLHHYAIACHVVMVVAAGHAKDMRPVWDSARVPVPVGHRPRHILVLMEQEVINVIPGGMTHLPAVAAGILPDLDRNLTGTAEFLPRLRSSYIHLELAALVLFVEGMGVHPLAVHYHHVLMVEVPVQG